MPKKVYFNFKIKHLYFFRDLKLTIYQLQSIKVNFTEDELRWKLKNLSRGLNPPKSAKTRFKFSAGLNLETF